MHGGVAVKDIRLPNAEGLKKGFENMDKHIRNLHSFGQKVLVAFNKYHFDTDEEIELLKKHCESLGVQFALNNAFAEGGKGAEELAHKVVELTETTENSPIQFTYNDSDSIETKIENIASKIYGAKKVVISEKAEKMLLKIEELGVSHYPVCIAKTQYSFSDDEKQYGVAKDFTFHVSDLVINNGAEFIVVIAGSMMRMPGLPKEPQAKYIDIVDGEIVGLS
jgi:formate--tetrahydrofolate ligase